jgi:hypothetical protein
LLSIEMVWLKIYLSDKETVSYFSGLMWIF